MCARRWRPTPVFVERVESPGTPPELRAGVTFNQEESPAGAGLLQAGYFAGAVSLTGVPSALVFSLCLFAPSRRRSIRPSRRSCATFVPSAFFLSSKIL